MRYYETGFLIAPDLSEEETEQLIGQMEDVVKNNKGKMVHVDKWGKRKLAYLIKKHDSAFYVFFYYEGTPATYAELERQFKQKEAIIRHLTLKKEELPLMEEEKKKPEKKKPAPKKETEEKPEKKENQKKPDKDTSTKAAPDKKAKEKEINKTKEGEE